MQPATELIRTTEVWLSVTLMTSTWFLISSPFLMIPSGALDRGGPHSLVTAS